MRHVSTLIKFILFIINETYNALIRQICNENYLICTTNAGKYMVRNKTRGRINIFNSDMDKNPSYHISSKYTI